VPISKAATFLSQEQLWYDKCLSLLTSLYLEWSLPQIFIGRRFIIAPFIRYTGLPHLFMLHKNYEVLETTDFAIIGWIQSVRMFETSLNNEKDIIIIIIIIIIINSKWVFTWWQYATIQDDTIQYEYSKIQ